MILILCSDGYFFTKIASAFQCDVLQFLSHVRVTRAIIAPHVSHWERTTIVTVRMTTRERTANWVCQNINIHFITKSIAGSRYDIIF